MIRVLLTAAMLWSCSPAEPSAVSAPSVVVQAPATLQARLEAVASGAGGQLGVAVKDLRTGWTAAVRGGDPFPQQSVFKLWVGLAVLDAADRGVLRLDEPLVLRREDLSVFHQPVAEKVDADGYRTTLGELLRYMVEESDNAAADLLIRRLGGPAAVQAVLNRKGVRGIRVDRAERDLQSEISGLRWRPEFTDPAAFERARAAVPDHVRTRARDLYLADARDTATPTGTVEALAALHEGRLLSPASTRRLLDMMRASRLGPNRLRAGLAPGWTLAHRTGSGSSWRGTTVAVNNIGLLTAPDGRTYAVAAFLKQTQAPERNREAPLAEVARAVVAQWTAERAAAQAARERRAM
ncbi:MAG: class A beta-lactamase [Pseudomonadota bacterium]|nr:class A beta-lactamase [Pseudomonadota bacterium]